MNEKRTIMSALDYSIASLQNLKKGMMDIGGKNQEMAWALGGNITILTANLIKIATQVFEDTIKAKEGDAKTDMLDIKNQYVKFLDQMINPE